MLYMYRDDEKREANLQNSIDRFQFKGKLNKILFSNLIPLAHRTIVNIWKAEWIFRR